mgnify:CR=1 FL=1
MAASRLHRLLRMVLVLRGRGYTTADELAEQFNVTVRTIYRDIEALQKNGVPIRPIRGREGGYRLEDESPLSSFESLTSLGSTDAAVLFALSISQSGTEGYRNTLEHIAKDLSQEEIEQFKAFSERIYFDTQEWYWRDTGESLVPKLRRALLNRCRIIIRFQERDFKKQRSDLVNPYGLVWKGGQWYLVGRSKTEKKIRRYRVSRVFDAEENGTHFKYPDGFFLKDWWHDDLEGFGKGNITVKLLAGLDARSELAKLSTKRETLLENIGKMLQVTLFVDNWEWLVPIILSYGGNVVVTEPPDLQQVILDSYQEALNAQTHMSPRHNSVGHDDIRSRATKGRELD